MARPAWCPGCTTATSPYSERYGAWLGEQSHGAPCDLCSIRWLFVVSLGGRTGSTTLLNMLNAHPTISLAGENDNMLADALRLWLKASRQQHTSAPWQRRPPRPAALLCRLQQWFGEVARGPSRGSNQTIRGFKEIRWLVPSERLPGEPPDPTLGYATQLNLPAGMSADVSLLLRFAAMLFPCSRFVFNGRGNNGSPRAVRARAVFRAPKPSQATSQADDEARPSPQISDAAAVAAARWRRSEALTEQLRTEAAAMHAAWQQRAATAWRSAWLEAEHFSVSNFNSLLEWMGERGCRYRTLLHDNSGGGSGAPPLSGKELRLLVLRNESGCTLG